ncbi:MAG: M48 family metallopeptidase [Candidatus Symbiothrix sp.]|jgi:predicted metal-dependent hydrolase|nr:M48 family metallopeptidase [Candidatus Symbiothrix sp.]
MNVLKTITDPQLGKIVYRHNSRARKYIIRIKADGVTVTVPWGGNLSTAESFFKKNRESVLGVRDKVNARKATPSFGANRPDDTYLASLAKLSLPKQLADIAQAHGFTYLSVKTRKSKTRWGSCSSKKTISLSYYLLLLPQHLIDYVLLHELCHTVHMNHGPAFWALLDQHTGSKSKVFQKELRSYHIPNS